MAGLVAQAHIPETACYPIMPRSLPQVLPTYPWRHAVVGSKWPQVVALGSSPHYIIAPYICGSRKIMKYQVVHLAGCFQFQGEMKNPMTKVQLQLRNVRMLMYIVLYAE